MDDNRDISRFEPENTLADVREIEQGPSQSTNVLSSPRSAIPSNAMISDTIMATTPSSNVDAIQNIPRKHMGALLSPSRQSLGPTTTNSTSSPLLKLPRELRNRVYRFALVDTDYIRITTTNWAAHQPGLLQTCRQIRFEALPIFYVENRIVIEIHDWDPAVGQRLHELAYRNGVCLPVLLHYFSGSPNWDNLLAWLKGSMRESLIQSRTA